MKIYVYFRDGKIKNIDRTGECYYEAWDDFREIFKPEAVYPDAEVPEDAFDEFCDDVSNGVFESEFDIIEWDLE